MNALSTSKRNFLKGRIEKLESLRWKMNRMQQYFHIYGRPHMVAVYEERIMSIRLALRELYPIFNELEDARIQEYNNSDTHKMLMATKGLNGSQILMLASN